MRLRSLIFLFLFALLLAGCGAGGSYDAPPAPMYAQATSPVSFDQNVDGGVVRADSADLPKGEGAGVSLDQKLVKNASVTVQVRDDDDFEPTVARLETVAKKLEGYVQNQTRNSIVFKVPSGRLDEALAAVAELGKVKFRNVSTVDVTANYVDLQIRIDNLQKMRTRLQQLVEQGTTVEAILQVEKELGRVTMELEALEGRMRVLQNQVTFATVAITIEEKVTPGPIGWVFYGGYKVVKWLFVWD